MADQQYYWPAADQVSTIGKSHDRQDGLVKSTGAAKYTYDINLPKQLIVKALGCPHAHCRIKAIDTRAAEKVPGVVHVHIFDNPSRAPHKDEDGNPAFYEVQFQGDLLAAVAAESEAAAAEGVAQINVEYEMLDVFVNDADLEAAEQAGRTAKGGLRLDLDTDDEPADDEDEEEFENKILQNVFQECKHIVEGRYGIDSITHCCLEPHGSTVQWEGDKLTAYLSTQNVSGTDEGFANALKEFNLTAGDVEVRCDYIGGGFGSKFSPDYWAAAAAKISKATGRPVKFMLDRDQELKIAGNRPSGYVHVQLGADENGVVQVWDSHHWGSSGFRPGTLRADNFPYVFKPKNVRAKGTAIKTNAGRQRAWRAPHHPQSCAITQTAYDDLARQMGADSLDIFRRNLQHLSDQQRAGVYAEEMTIGAELMDWKAKWHAHGKGPVAGSIVEGLGMGIHTWGGGANKSICRLKIHPDGSVEAFCGTQDLGTGTRTICAQVLAETFGLSVDDVNIHIGSSKYPDSGASGGSTTVGAVCESHRRAGQDALAKLFELAAKKLNAAADDLEASGGRIQVRGDANSSLSWNEACGLLGIEPLEVTVARTRPENRQSPLSDSGVGGVQMAHVAVDRETGVVKIKKFVAVQDMGLVINPKLAKSQINGAVIMSIAYALFEERILDPDNGAFLNAEMADYRLPRLGDIGEIVVELYEPESERQRGVIGLGEPPVISGGAAISNAVCNALGVRVPYLPLTPKRVLDALS